MKVFGIVAEYNPFHNGHLHQINETKRLGATHIAAVMSGNFVQRGDTALLDKFTRARLAVLGGVDLVLELPVAYALSSAEYFARGAVSLLGNLGCVDGVSFGSECGEISELESAADAAVRINNSYELRGLLKNGAPYPAAMQALAEKNHGKGISLIFSSPNNLLGIEYLKAVKHLGLNLETVTIPRKNAMHDSDISRGGIASASYIRNIILNGKDCSEFVPADVYKAVLYAAEMGKTADILRLEKIILYKIRTLGPGEAENLPDADQGLQGRIIDGAKNAVSLEGLFAAVKTKRYPMARIRRIILSALLGLTKHDTEILPQYGRILAMNDKGCEILKTAREKTDFPFDTSLAKLSSLSDTANRFAENEIRAGDIYALASENPSVCGSDLTAKITKI